MMRFGIWECDYDLAGAIHNMAVGEYEAVRSENKAGASSLSIAWDSRRILYRALTNRNVHHSGSNRLDRRCYSAGVSIQQRCVFVNVWGGCQRRLRCDRRIKKVQL